MCPNDCSGHGKCRLVQDLPHANSPVAYTLWDTDKIQGCVCDGGYTGPDCAARLCPRGDDPMTTCGETTTNANQIQTISVRGSHNARLSAIAAAYTAKATPPAGQSYSGELAIKFTDNTGELWVTNRVSDVFGPGADSAIATALTSLPNFRIPAVTVTASDALAPYRTFTVEFTDARTSGSQATLTFDSPLGCAVAGCHPLYKQPMFVRIGPAVGGTTNVNAAPQTTWSVTTDSQLQTNLMPAAAQSGLSFAALVTIFPSSTAPVTANDPSTLPAHAYKVDWDLSKRYNFGGQSAGAAEQYAVVMSGTVVKAGTTFTLTFRGLTTDPITWDPTTNAVTTSSATVGSIAYNIKSALDAPAMQLGGAGATTVTCAAGFNPVTSATYLAGVGTGTGVCTVSLNFLDAPVSSSLFGNVISFATGTVGASLFVGKKAGVTGTLSGLATLSLDGLSVTAGAGHSCASATNFQSDVTAGIPVVAGVRSVYINCLAGSVLASPFEVYYSSATAARISITVAGGTAFPAVTAAPQYSFATSWTIQVVLASSAGTASVTINYKGVVATVTFPVSGSGNPTLALSTIQTALDTAFGTDIFTAISETNAANSVTAVLGLNTNGATQSPLVLGVDGVYATSATSTPTGAVLSQQVTLTVGASVTGSFVLNQKVSRTVRRVVGLSQLNREMVRTCDDEHPWWLRGGFTERCDGSHPRHVRQRLSRYVDQGDGAGGR